MEKEYIQRLKQLRHDLSIGLISEQEVLKLIPDYKTHLKTLETLERLSKSINGDA